MRTKRNTQNDYASLLNIGSLLILVTVLAGPTDLPGGAFLRGLTLGVGVTCCALGLFLRGRSHA